MNRYASLRTGALAISILIASLPVVPAAFGQTSGDSWEFIVSPYVWGAAMDGTMVVEGREAEVDLSASDIFDHLDTGFMGLAAARKGNWGIGGDVVWVDLGADTDMPPAEVDPSLGILTLQGMRRISGFADVTFGARWNRLNGRIRFKAPIGIEVEMTRDWVDPVVGVVLRTPGEHRWHGTLIADIGGFGAGSDLTWQLFPSVGFDLSKHASIEAGYRILDTDYETGDDAEHFEYDMRLQGPVAGLAFRF
ncbi:MAG TPA: hypothetical protein VGR67_15715 [Candidatus Polarisedimenticolia bacterium]|jgi:hypothetical protein|nr:hypothetical protein [Candidatus Polarisedimenticolia bacterium]